MSCNIGIVLSDFVVVGERRVGGGTGHERAKQRLRRDLDATPSRPQRQIPN